MYEDFLQTAVGIADSGFQLLQENAGVIFTAFLGSYGATRTYHKYAHPTAKRVTRLHRTLGYMGRSPRLTKPVAVRYLFVNPYGNDGIARNMAQMWSGHYINSWADRVCILSGRKGEGLSTLLAVTIPWYKRWGPWAYKGIVLKGDTSKSYKTLDDWQTAEMFGLSTTKGAELARALEEYRETQKIRLFFSDFLPFVAPRVPYVIVENCEELMKNFRDEALYWLLHVANYQLRDSKARVILVFNSQECATSFAKNNLLGFYRIDVQKLKDAQERQLRRIFNMFFERAPKKNIRYENCQKNIGLYKESLRLNIPDSAVEQWAKLRLRETSSNDTINTFHETWTRVHPNLFQYLFLESLKSPVM